MIREKGKRKLVWNGQVYYWYIQNNETGYPYVYVFSGDKKLRLAGPLIDKEAIGGPRDVVALLESNWNQREQQERIEKTKMNRDPNREGASQ